MSRAIAASFAQPVMTKATGGDLMQKGSLWLSLRTAVKWLLSTVLLRYRGGNQYDLDFNYGLLKIDRLDPLPEVSIGSPFGMALIDCSRWSHSWTRSQEGLGKIMPVEYAARLSRLHPLVVRSFFLAHVDAREGRDALFPCRYAEMVLGPYVAISEEAGGKCRLCLTKDFGGYFHFLIEIFPLILAIRSVRTVEVMVASELIGQYRFIPSAFASAGVDWRVGAASDLSPVSIADLIPCSQVAYYYPNRASIQILRCAFAKEPVSLDAHPRRIVISRRAGNKTNGRLLANEAEVLDRLSGLGFSAFHAEDHTFEQQQQVFAAAEIVLGVAGAGLSNTVFMRKGAMVVELMPRAEFKWHFALLARCCELSYSLLEVEVLEQVDNRPLWLKVDVEGLAKLVEDELQRQSRSPSDRGAPRQQEVGG